MQIFSLFEWLVDPCIAFVRRNCREVVTTADINLPVSLMNLFSSQLDSFRPTAANEPLVHSRPINPLRFTILMSTLMHCLSTSGPPPPPPPPTPSPAFVCPCTIRFMELPQRQHSQNPPSLLTCSVASRYFLPHMTTKFMRRDGQLTQKQSSSAVRHSILFSTLGTWHQQVTLFSHRLYDLPSVTVSAPMHAGGPY